MGIQSRNSDSWLFAPALLEECRKQAADADDLGLFQKTRHIRKGHMGCYQADGQPATGQAHRKVLHPRPICKKFCLTWKPAADIMQPLLRDRPCDDRLPFSGEQIFCRDFQGFDRRAGGFFCGRSGLVAGHISHDLEFEISGKIAGGQGCADDLRADAGRIT